MTKIKITLLPGSYVFFICYLAASQPTLGHYHLPDFHQCVIQFRQERHQEPHKKVGSLNLDECLVVVKPVTFQFHHNVSTKKPTLPKGHFR